MLLSVFLGQGTQIFIMTFITLCERVFTFIGLLSGLPTVEGEPSKILVEFKQSRGVLCLQPAERSPVISMFRVAV